MFESPAPPCPLARYDTLPRKNKSERKKYKWLAEQERRERARFPGSERDAWPSLSRKNNKNDNKDNWEAIQW